MKIKVQDTTPKNVRQLVFKLLDILSEIGIPTDKSDRRLERMAKACLAVGNIRKSFKDAISETANQFLKTRDIIAFENKYLGENISPGSYDDVRRLDLQLLVEAGIIINSASKRNWRQIALIGDMRSVLFLRSCYNSILLICGTQNWKSLRLK